MESHGGVRHHYDNSDSLGNLTSIGNHRIGFVTMAKPIESTLGPVFVIGDCTIWAGGRTALSLFQLLP